ncbi:MAG: hypothetical protein ABI395_02690 [Sphingobium sp.]
MVDRFLRKEAMQRIQVGLTGLAGIVLMVALANVVVRNIRPGDGSGSAAMGSAANASNAYENGDAPREPLAELGVTPAADPAVGAVPDLQPDPKISKPMDRDPASSTR